MEVGLELEDRKKGKTKYQEILLVRSLFYGSFLNFLRLL